MVSPALERRPDSGLRNNLRLVRELRPGAVLPGLRDTVKELPGDLTRNARQYAFLRVESTLENPPGWLLALLRRFHPVLKKGRMTLVTRADDVRHVLNNEQAFTVRPYGRTMEHFAGPFALGLDGAQHAQAREKLDSLLAPIDSGKLRTWATDVAEQLVTERAHSGRLDVVTGLAEPLPVRFVAEFFGVSGPDEQTLIKWAKKLFEGTFLNVGHQRSLEAEADSVAAEMRAYVDEEIARARRRDTTTVTTVLDRLIAMESDDTMIRTTLVGLVLATIPTVTEALVRATDRLLRTRSAFAGARTAAQQADDELLWQCIREALRFRPQTSYLVRAAADSTAVAGTPRHLQQIRERDVVLAATASAMRDPAMVARPLRFRTDRPDSAYLHFGDGPHRCLGERIAPVLLTAGVGALFRRPALRRVPGRAGRLQTTGRWPAHLMVTV
jgi:cytochrome P450